MIKLTREPCFEQLIILTDTRERTPWTFEDWPVLCVKAALPSGDYSLPGFETRVAIERKSLDDLTGSLSRDRRRFEREMQRLGTYDLAAVIIEASLSDITDHVYRSEMKPQAILASVFAFWIRYHVPFVFACDRSGAEAICYGLLRMYARERWRRCYDLIQGQAVAGVAHAERS